MWYRKLSLIWPPFQRCLVFGLPAVVPTVAGRCGSVRSVCDTWASQLVCSPAIQTCRSEDGNSRPDARTLLGRSQHSLQLKEAWTKEHVGICRNKPLAERFAHQSASCGKVEAFKWVQSCLGCIFNLYCM